MHIQSPHARRDIPVIPTAIGVSPTTVVAHPDTGTATSLLLAGTGTGPRPSVSLSIDLVPGSTIILTSAAAPPPTNTASASGPPAAAGAGAGAGAGATSSPGPSVGTLIGACVGALAGAALLILSALFLLRRWARAQKAAAATTRTRATALRADQSRRRSHLEPWARLGEKGAGKAATPAPSPGGAEQGAMTQMFSGTPSLHSTTTKLTSGWALDDAEPAGGPRTFLHMRMSTASGAVSPTLVVARQTPSATTPDHALPRWESAVVVDPFADAHAYDGVEAVAPVVPAVAPAPVVPEVSARERADLARNQSRRISANHTFFGRAADNDDPFADAHLAKARALAHRPALSDASTAPSEHAMQSLLAALDLPRDEDGRARVASVQASEASRYSSALDDDETVLPDFPLPPSTRGSAHEHGAR